MICLHCGKPLTRKDADSGWHRRCSRSFFGTDSVPTVEATGEALETLAATSVGSGKTVAGVQRKLSVHMSEVHGTYRLTLVGYPSGFILKPQTPEYPQLPELEHVTMTLAERVGIKTVPHGLIKLADGSPAYITRRIPMEDMCQLSERLIETVLRHSKTMPPLIEASPLSPSARERFTDIVRGRAEQLRS